MERDLANPLCSSAQSEMCVRAHVYMYTCWSSVVLTGDGVMVFLHQPVTHLIFFLPSLSSTLSYVDTWMKWHMFQSNLWQWPHWFSSSAFVSKHVLHLSFSTLLDFLPLLSVRQMRLSSTQPLHSAASAIVGKLHRLLKIEQPATLQDFFFFFSWWRGGSGAKSKNDAYPFRDVW